MKEIAIFGAGISGLAAAWKLSEQGYNVHIIEKRTKIAGMSGSINLYDAELDLGPHKIYSQLPVLKEIKELLKDDLIIIPKYSRIRLFGKYFEYPLKITDLLLKVNPLISISMGFSYVFTSLKNIVRKPKDTNYESYLVTRFGSKLYKYVFESYAAKAWDNPKKLDANLAKSRIVLPSLYELIKNILFRSKEKTLSADEFYYPSKGIGELSERMLKKAKGAKLYLNSDIKKINFKDGQLKSVTIEKDNKKKEINSDKIISTIPLRDLLNLMKDVPKNIKESSKTLKFRDLTLLYLNVNKPRLFKDNWIFFPEKKYIFNRISEQKSFSENTVPKDKTVLCVEITSPEKSKYSKEELYNLVIKQLEECEILTKDQILAKSMLNLKLGYPIYNVDYQKQIKEILDYLDSQKNILTIGRLGLFNYVGMIDCIDMAFKASEFIKSGKDIEDWKKIRKGFFNYVTID